MARTDLLRALELHARSVDPESVALANFIETHAEQLVAALPVSIDRFGAFVGELDVNLGPSVLVLLDRLKAERRDQQRRGRREKAERAVRELESSVRWRDDRAFLSVDLLLGPVLADTSVAHVVFVLPDGVEIFIERWRLIEVARAVSKFPRLDAWVEARGLTVAWMGGRGRIHLYPQAVTAMPADRLLRVVLPRVTASLTSPARALTWLDAWTESVLEEVAS